MNQVLFSCFAGVFVWCFYHSLLCVKLLRLSFVSCLLVLVVILKMPSGMVNCDVCELLF